MRCSLGFKVGTRAFGTTQRYHRGWRCQQARRRTAGTENLPGVGDHPKEDPAGLDVARRLWQEAGVDPKNVKMDFLYTTEAFGSYNELLSTLLSATGVKVNGLGQTAVASAATRLQGNVDLVVDPANNAFEDPQDVVIPNTVTGAARKWGKWSNPKVDELAAVQERAVDPAAPRQLLFQLHLEELDWAVYLPVTQLASLYATRGYGEGFILDPSFNVSSVHKLETVWFNK